MTDGKKTRARNFTADEIDILVDEVTKHTVVLFAKQSDTVTNSLKTKRWAKIASLLNAVNGKGDRTGNNVRKKWYDLSNETKRKEVNKRKDQKKTGGGKPDSDPITPLEEKIISVISKTLIEGIKDGVDTASENIEFEIVNEEEEDEEINVEEVTDDAASTSTNLNTNCSSTTCTSTPTISEDKVPASSINLNKRRKLNFEGDDKEQSAKPKSTKPNTSKHSSTLLIDIEKEKLEIDKRRLAMEEQRLTMEERRLNLEERRLQFEEQRLALEKQQRWANLYPPSLASSACRTSYPPETFSSSSHETSERSPEKLHYLTSMISSGSSSYPYMPESSSYNNLYPMSNYCPNSQN
jgi:hypothetical protein